MQPSFVNAVSETPSASGPQSVTLSPVTPGNVLYAFVCEALAGGGTAFTVSDPTNGQWEQIGDTYAPANGAGSVAQFWVTNAAIGPLTVTASNNAPGGAPVLTVLQFSGVASLLGFGAGATAQTSPATSGPFAAAPGNLIVFGIGMAVSAEDTVGFSEGGGMAIPTGASVSGPNGAAAVEYAIAGAGSTNATMGFSGDGANWAGGLAAVFGTGAVTPPPVVVPPIPPAPPAPGVRLIGGLVSPSDMYYNSPVNTLPVDALSNAKIAALGAGHLGCEPEFLLNLATNATPTVPSSEIAWGETDGETDSGNYPIGQDALVSNFAFGLNPTVGNAPAGGYGQDDHILVLNTDTGFLYETYAITTNAPPYAMAAGSIYNVSDYNLRTAYKVVPPVVDSDGLDNGTACGMPIWPFVLTHAEAFAGQPILHALRLTLPAPVVTQGYQWPATHTGNGTGTAGIMMGCCFRLKASFDISTFPPAFQQVLIAMQTYGLWLCDIGTALISLDADQAWGDGAAGSDLSTFATSIHEVNFSDLEVVDNMPRVIDATSGQVNPAFVPR